MWLGAINVKGSGDLSEVRDNLRSIIRLCSGGLRLQADSQHLDQHDDGQAEGR